MPSVPLFPLVRKHLAPTLGALGFLELNESRGGGLAQWWGRSDGLRLYVQRFHQPWMVPWLGNTFTLGLELESSGVLSPLDGRLYFLLSDTELTEMRRLHDLVVAKLPEPGPEADLLEVELSGVRDSRASYSKPWARNHEVWFRYQSRNDLTGWFEFIKAVLPTCVNRFRERVLA